MSILAKKGWSSFEKTNIRLFNRMRAILAFATLLVVYIIPTEPQGNTALIYAVLILYNLYTVSLIFLSNRKPDLIPLNYTHWIDVGWCLILIILSSGTNSIFFFMFFFGLLEASFRFGYYEGLRITLVSALLFIVFGYLTAPAEGFEMNRFLLRPVYLCILGYLIAYWGGQELRNKRRLAVLKDITRLYNPRFGVDQTAASIMEKILGTFEADSCLLITTNQNSSSYVLRQAYKTNPEQAIHAEHIDSKSPLLTIPHDYVIIYRDSGVRRITEKKKYTVLNSEDGQEIKEPERNGELLADLLETKSFISIPLHRKGAVAGRIYLTSKTKGFDYSDMEFLSQLVEHVIPVVENVKLLDHLASEATEQQRQKISRDIHDSTVQPYIGLKLGLEALQMKHESGEDVAYDIERLINMTTANINDVRSYINRLKTDVPDTKKGSVLVSAVKKQADKLSEYYGMEIEVKAKEDIQINDRLSAEVFQIITEGLSNIRRHTNADYALIIIECDDKKLNIDIQNNNPNGQSLSEFIPKSITGRAQSLGGQASVKKEDNRTKVSVEIPL